MMSRYVAHAGRQPQFFRRPNLGWQDMEGEIEAAILAQRVAAKAAHARDLVAEVEVVGLLEARELLVGEQVANEPSRLLDIEWIAFETNERAEAAHNGRGAGRQVQIRAAHHERPFQQSIDLRLGPLA